MVLRSAINLSILDFKSILIEFTVAFSVTINLSILDFKFLIYIIYYVTVIL